MEDRQGEENHLLERLKLAVISVMNGGKTDPIEIPALIFSKNERIDDVSTKELIYLTIPFIGMAQLDKENASDAAYEYLNELSLLNAVTPRLVKLWHESRTGECSREARIFLFQTVKAFSISYPQWDDREWLLELIKCIFCKTISLYIHQTREKSIKKAQHYDSPNKQLKCYKIMGDGRPVPIPVSRGASVPSIPSELVNRSDLLKRCGGPTMSLEEYASKMIDMMKMVEGKKVVEGNSNDEELFLEEGSDERNNLIKEDDISDQKRSNLGNTMGMG